MASVCLHKTREAEDKEGRKTEGRKGEGKGKGKKRKKEKERESKKENS